MNANNQGLGANETMTSYKNFKKVHQHEAIYCPSSVKALNSYPVKNLSSQLTHLELALKLTVGSF